MKPEIWRLNVLDRTLIRQPVQEDCVRLGGRGLTARILLSEVLPTCEPLGSTNKLIFAPGLLGGILLSSCDRLSVGGKSPLTGGIKESNSGGVTGALLASRKIKALILEGVAKPPASWVIVLSEEGARFEPATHLIGVGTYETARLLREMYGEKVAILLIGPAGERLLRGAGIHNLDLQGRPSRIHARGGMGAVMGSKGIKAIVIEPSTEDKPELADPVRYRLAQKQFLQAVVGHPQSAVYRDFSTPGILGTAQAFGALPTRNFSTGKFEHADELSGEYFRDTVRERGGEGRLSHRCQTGCLIRCSNVFADPNGKETVSALEYETLGLMGSNLGIGSLDDVASLNWHANDLGLDTIELGAALGVAAEAGYMRFGDATSAQSLIDEIRHDTPLGRIVGNGAYLCGKVLGVRRIPTAKRQAFSAYDPRAIKGSGVTYATSPQGADHTAGHTIREKVNHLDPHGQAALSRKLQVERAACDVLGMCMFASFGIGSASEIIAELLNSRYGWSVGVEIVEVLGKQTLEMEREFNRQAGFTPIDDRLPEWVSQEILPSTGSVFDVPDIELDGVFEW